MKTSENRRFDKLKQQNQPVFSTFLRTFFPKIFGKNLKATAVVFAAVVSFSVFCLSCASSPTPHYILNLRDEKTGISIARYNLDEYGQFSVSFMHSVNRSIVEEGYRVEDGVISLDWCLYSSFGAGVATTVEDGQKLSYTEDGKMLITGFNRPITRLSYEVSTIYDHYLHIGSTVINLTELGLKGKRVLFEAVKTH